MQKINKESNGQYFNQDERKRCQIFRETSAFEDVPSVTALFNEIA